METPKQVYQRLVELGSDWANKEYAASLLEETKKSVLSKFRGLYTLQTHSY